MCSITLTYPARSHFQRTLSRERQDKGLNEHCHSSGEGEDGQENDRPILKTLCAALLRSFRGLHGEKMVCMRGVPGVTGTLGKTNSHFDPTHTGRGPHHHVEAAVDWCSSILLALHVHTIYTTEISHFTIQKDRSQYVFWGRTESW